MVWRGGLRKHYLEHPPGNPHHALIVAHRCPVVTHFEVGPTRKVDVKCGAHLPVMGSPS